jgi:Fe2+ or Zn2+ uptake regulation protein
MRPEDGKSRSTAQRRAILAAIGRFDHHPTADEIFREVNRDLPLTSRATVYNTLNRLKEAGVLEELHQRGVTRFDANARPHHHFECTRCGRIADVAWELVPELACPRLDAGMVESYSVTFSGICWACQSPSRGEWKEEPTI